ncbi:phage holin family protein [Armatimonas sp.]|uniref:phage holin family protein n=1 Tax=Armatimonas sp. TaxID=1872638 RepID=UPI003753B4E5
MNWIVRWIVGAVALYLTVFSWSYVQPLAPFLGGKRGLVLDGAVGAFFAIAVVTLVNAFVGPLLRLLAAPLNCLTMGLMRFVVNALLFWIAGSVGLGLSVQGFLPALYGSIALSSISGVLDLLIPKDKD